MHTGKREAPRAEEFGLQAGLTLGQAEARMKSFKAQADLRSLIVFICYIAITGYVAFSLLEFGWAWAACFVASLFYLANLNDFIRDQYIESKAEHLPEFIRETRQWIEFNTEQGFGYWRDQRGRQFEESVAKFFQRRGWKATLTRTTGDGGSTSY